jgi:hypothetical protein
MARDGWEMVDIPGLLSLAAVCPASQRGASVVNPDRTARNHLLSSAEEQGRVGILHGPFERFGADWGVDGRRAIRQKPGDERDPASAPL